MIAFDKLPMILIVSLLSARLAIAVQADIFQPAEPDLSGLYVVMFTADYCGPCRAYKSGGQLADLESQIAVTLSDVQRGGSRWHNGNIPCFWICDKATRRPLKKFAPGVVKPAELIRAARGLVR